MPTRIDTGRFFIDEIVRHDERTVVAQRRLDDRDSYLRHHLVTGKPTMPGCFVAEMAAEAALALVPESVVTGFRDLRFEHFLKLTGTLPIRITATVAGRQGPRAVVDVRVSAHVTAPSGRTLVSDRTHFTCRVVLDAAYPAAPVWGAWPRVPEVPLPEPYYAQGSPVQLSGPFLGTMRLRVHPLGARADYARPGNLSDFSGFIVPVLLLDNLLRLSVLDLLEGSHVPVAAPQTIRRIDLHAPGGDAAIIDTLGLFSTPRGGAWTDSGCRAVAVGPDGRVLLQLKDATGLHVGYLDTATKTHVNVQDAGGPLRPSTHIGALAL